MRLSRRVFIRSSALLWLSLLGFRHRGDAPVLRPPGATRDFLARCIRCGRCGEACPYDSIKFFDISAGANFATPYINPLETHCYLCLTRSGGGGGGKQEKPRLDKPLSEFLLCGEACPTGALRKIRNDRDTLLSLPDELKMGVSELNRELCLAWQYDSCGECYYNCPLRDDAMLAYPPDEVITGAVGIRPYVDERHCVGCGMCNYVCPVNERIARATVESGRRLTYFEERYAAMVRNVIGRAGHKVRLPAVRVVKRV